MGRITITENDFLNVYKDSYYICAGRDHRSDIVVELKIFEREFKKRANTRGSTTEHGYYEYEKNVQAQDIVNDVCLEAWLGILEGNLGDSTRIVNYVRDALKYVSRLRYCSAQEKESEEKIIAYDKFKCELAEAAEESNNNALLFILETCRTSEKQIPALRRLHEYIFYPAILQNRKEHDEEVRKIREKSSIK
jgi:hypothetical protein